MTSPARVEWVLFDWGNVLVEYRPLGIAKLAQRLGVELEAMSQYASSTRILRDLSIGALSPEQGVELLTQRFGVPLTRADVVDCFRGDVEHELPGIRALVAELRRSYRLAILSNAFFGHWDSFEGSELYQMFELPMASHLIKALKPSPAAYQTALERMGAQPAKVVFIDDRADNVQAARELGMHAFVTDSVAKTRA